MVYKTDLDGANTEGFGAILQRVIHLYVFGKIFNKSIEITKFKNLAHYQHENKSKVLFHSEINSFLSFETEKAESINNVFVEPDYLLRFIGELYLNKKKSYINELTKKINYSSDLYFKTDKTISIHIRNKNKLDTDFNINRELLSAQKHLFYKNLLNYLIYNYKNHEIHVFSQGNEKEFTFLVDFPIKLHLNTPLIETFYHLMTSKILVTSNSSLSWTAHLFGLNEKVYARHTFFHSWYLGTILLSKRGNPLNRTLSHVLIQLNRIKLFFLFFKVKLKRLLVQHK